MAELCATVRSRARACTGDSRPARPPQVGAPNFREFAWEGDSTVLDCVLCVKLAKQHISLTRSVRSQPCQWDVVMQLIPFGVALCAPSENLVVRIVLLGRFLLSAGESVHVKSKTAVIYSRALERIRAAETNLTILQACRLQKKKYRRFVVFFKPQRP